MEYILYLILCSSVAGECMPPFEVRDHIYKDSYSCMLAGSYKSIIKLEEIGRDSVNKNGLYIKFICNEAVKS